MQNKYSTDKITSLIFALVIALSSTIILENAQASVANDSYAYSVGTNSVIFSGPNVTLEFGDQKYDVNWDVVVMGSGSTQNLIFNNRSYSVINNTAQNSVVMIENDGMVKVSQIYSFINGSIDTSIAIENANQHNATFLVSFAMYTGYNQYVYLNGFDPETQVMRAITTGLYMALIPSSDWQASLGDAKVNWLTELSVFHGGFVYSDYSTDLAILPFGPVTIPTNETYSIDPTVSQTPSSPVAVYQNSTSNGTSNSTLQPQTNPLGAPKITSYNLSVGHFTYGAVNYPGGKSWPKWLSTIPGNTTFWLNGTDTLGAGGDTLTVYGLFHNPVNNSIATEVALYSHSWSSTTINVSWPAKPGYYSGISVVLSNSYGANGPLIGRNFEIYTYTTINKWSQGASLGSIYASNGSLVGKIVESFYYDPEPFHTGSQTTTQFSASFIPLKTYSQLGVYEVYMNNSFLNNNASSASGSSVYQIPNNPTVQNNSTRVEDSQAVVTALAYATAFIPDIGGYVSDALFAYANYQSTTNLGWYSNYGNGHGYFNVSIPSPPSGDPEGYIIQPGGTFLNYVPAYSFGMFNNMTFNAPLTAPTHNDTNNTYLNQFTFTSYFAVVPNNETYAYGGPVTEPIYLAQW